MKTGPTTSKVGKLSDAWQNLFKAKTKVDKDEDDASAPDEKKGHVCLPCLTSFCHGDSADRRQLDKVGCTLSAIFRKRRNDLYHHSALHTKENSKILKFPYCKRVTL